MDSSMSLDEYLYPSNHHHEDMEHFHPPGRFPHTPLLRSPPRQPLIGFLCPKLSFTSSNPQPMLCCQSVDSLT